MTSSISGEGITGSSGPSGSLSSLSLSGLGFKTKPKAERAMLVWWGLQLHGNSFIDQTGSAVLPQRHCDSSSSSVSSRLLAFQMYPFPSAPTSAGLNPKENKTHGLLPGTSENRVLRRANTDLLVWFGLYCDALLHRRSGTRPHPPPPLPPLDGAWKWPSPQVELCLVRPPPWGAIAAKWARLQYCRSHTSHTFQAGHLHYRPGHTVYWASRLLSPQHCHKQQTDWSPRHS